MMNSLLRLLLVVTALLASPALAFGHAALTSSIPSDGVVLSEAPGQVELEFSEAITALSLALAFPDGSVQPIEASGEGNVLRLSMPASGLSGTYLVIYRVVSEDGHPVGGTLTFSIGRETEGAQTVAANATGGVPSLLLLASGLTYFSMLVVVGTAAVRFRREGARRVAENVTNLFVGLGLLALALSWPLQGSDLSGLSGMPLLDARVWQAPLSSPGWWRIPMLAGALLLCVVGNVSGPNRSGRVPGAMALLLFMAALISSGHSATAVDPWAMRVALLVHLTGILAWFGPLPLLAYALLKQGVQAHGPLARYSRYVPVPITMIVGSGSILALLQLGWPGPQWLSPYGAVLTTKLTLLAIITALAWHNRYRLTRPTLAGDRLCQQRLARSILMEIGVTFLVLVSVAGWRFTPPPATQPPLQEISAPIGLKVGGTHLHGTQVMAGLTIETAENGLRATLDLEDLAGKPLEAKSVDLRLTVPNPAMPPLEVSAYNVEGAWSAALPILPSGRWEAVVLVRVDDFTQVSLKGGVSVDIEQDEEPRDSAP